MLLCNVLNLSLASRGGHSRHNLVWYLKDGSAVAASLETCGSSAYRAPVPSGMPTQQARNAVAPCFASRVRPAKEKRYETA